jgi:hypothetical protein
VHAGTDILEWRLLGPRATSATRTHHSNTHSLSEHQEKRPLCVPDTLTHAHFTIFETHRLTHTHKQTEAHAHTLKRLSKLRSLRQRPNIGLFHVVRRRPRILVRYYNVSLRVDSWRDITIHIDRYRRNKHKHTLSHSRAHARRHTHTHTHTLTHARMHTHAHTHTHRVLMAQYPLVKLEGV